MISGSNGPDIQPTVYNLFNQNQVKIDKNTGALETTYPINIPPGRNDLQPDLDLIYNSQNSQQGSIFGEGWSISIPYISRFNKSGVDQLYSTSSLNYFTSSLDGEIISTTTVSSTGSSYVARTENGTFNKYTYASSSNTWTMIDKNGTTYVFGSSTDALQNDPNNSAHIYKWMLKTVTDTNGNTATYNYFKDSGQIYPSSTMYTGNGSSTGIFEVDFALTSTTDNNTSTATGFAVSSNYRVSQITAKVNGTWVRQYNLGYATGDNGYTTLLGSIAESGENASGTVVSLPSSTFTYQLQTPGWTSSSTWNPPTPFVASSSIDDGVRIGDLTGNGLPGIITSSSAWIDTPSGWVPSSTWAAPVNFVTGNGGDAGYRVIDLNNNGLDDIVSCTSSYINTGSGWMSSSTWNSPVCFAQNGVPTGAILADVTGDGLPAILYGSSSGTSAYAAYLDTGSGWATSTVWTPPVPFVANGGIDAGTRITDVTGYGLPDLLYAPTGASTSSEVFEVDPSSTLTTNLVSYWKFDNNSNDFYGPNNGTDSNMTYGTGKVGEAAQFNGTSSDITMNDTGMQTGNGARSWAGWVYPQDNTSTTEFLFGYGTRGTCDEYWRPYITSLALNVDIVCAGGSSASSIALTQNAWNFVVITYDGTNLKFYVNNAAAGSTTMQATPNTVLNDQGEFGDTPTDPNYFHGYLDEVGFWDRVLTAGEMTDLYNSGAGQTMVSATPTGALAYFNTGSGWATSTVWAPPLPFVSSGGWDNGVRIADVNGDGLPDLIQGYTGISGNPSSTAYLNTGHGWTQDNAWTPPAVFSSNGGYDQGTRLADVLGDGLPDIISGYADYLGVNHYAAWTNDNTIRADILTGITYPQGGTSAIEYEAATQANASATLANTVPYPVYVVSNITTKDGLGNTAASLGYQYSGGTYYYGSPVDHEFAGFGMVTQADAAGNVTKTYYDTSNGVSSSTGEYNDNFWKIGKAYRVESYDNANDLYRVTVTKWDSTSTGGNAAFVFPDQTLEMDYDGLPAHKDSAESFVWNPANGNKTQDVLWGQVTGSNNGTFATSTNGYATNYSYASSTTSNVIGKVWDEILLNQSSTKIQETQSYYDNLALGSIGAGNLTEEADWIASGTYATTENSYNSYGLVTKTLDPRNNTTTYTYDPYTLYPATTTNALNQTTNDQYDYSTGKVTQAIDPNGLRFQTSYDGVGRPLQVLQPDQVTTSTLDLKTAYVYTDTPDAVNVAETDYLNGSTTVVTYSYYDGLDRLIQTRKSATDAGIYKVSDQAYNNIGLLQKQSLPYFAASSTQTAATTTSALYAVYAYDPLGRALSVANAVGTTTYAYGSWNTTTTDPNGDVKMISLDAFGNLVQVNEYNGTSTYTTTYAYDGLKDLLGLTDANANVRSFAYDGLGREVSSTDLHPPTSTTYGIWTYAYDSAGNLTQRVDPKNQTTTWTYDALNRVSTEVFGGQTQIAYTYDACTNGVSRLCTVSSTEAASLVTKTYDPEGDLASETKKVGGVNYATSYTYDRQGDQLTITNPDGSEVVYTYGTGGLPTSVQEQEPGGSLNYIVSSLDYSPMDKTTVQDDANGVDTVDTYDPTRLYRLISTVTTDNGSQFGQLVQVGGTGGVQPLVLPLVGGGGGGNTVTFSCTSTEQSYTVPSGVTQIQIAAYGAEGGGAGGSGGEVAGTLGVTSGTTYYINVGCQNGYDGGGAGGTGSGNGASGGGMTWLSANNQFATSTVLLIAGGGGGAGGAGGGGGGTGGGSTGGAGGIGNISGCPEYCGGNGSGGTQSAGGSGSVQAGPGAYNGVAGVTGQGGFGGNGDSGGGGGGGGGGYYGGGGGGGNSAGYGGGGGGGGSSYIAATSYLTATSTVSGANSSGNGYLTITPILPVYPLNQYVIGTTSTINEGSSTYLGGVTFGGTLNSTASTSVAIQVEVEPAGTSFEGLPDVPNGPFVAPGSFATTTFYGPNGSYHWQAREVSVSGATTTWEVFGPTSTSTDFVLNSTVTESYTGSVATFTVPNEVTSLGINVYGAQGVSGGSPGGLGGEASGTLSVTQGANYYLYVGGQSGVNGGTGTGNGILGYGGNGGDMSWFGTSSTFSQSSVILVGGGGGGAGLASGYGGGYGGGLTGGSGSGLGAPGTGGTQTAGGTGGGSPGTQGQGGNGCGNCYYFGSGGGGGYWGGGGGGDNTGSGSEAGGGGGSSYLSSSLTNATTTAGVNSGTGSVVITEYFTLPLSSLGQYHSDGVTPINEGSSTNDETVIFGATLNANTSSSVQMQVEVEPAGAAFTYVPNVANSPFVVPGNNATTTFVGPNGSYHWQAREVNASGTASAWQSFGPTPNATDFVLTTTLNYGYTGSVQSFTVPAHVKQLVLTAYGAQGGSGGGLGGEASAAVAVTGGATYYFGVGQSGASGVCDSGPECSGGGGGGMTWFSPDNSFDSNVLLLAGGGGGSGGSGSTYTGAPETGGAGGYGGGGNGGNTNGSSPGGGGGGGGYYGGYGGGSVGGNGGTQTSGYASGQGAAGSNSVSTADAGGCAGGGGGGTSGSNGSTCYNSFGYANAGGGGGGSAYISTSTSVTATSTAVGVNSGNGLLTINEVYDPVPTLSSSSQYYSNGVTVLNEGSSTGQLPVILGATLNSWTRSNVQMQVEVEPSGTAFTGTPNIVGSPFVAPGGVATTSFFGSNGAYHWQARAIDAQNNTSTWKIFNSPTITSTTITKSYTGAIQSFTVPSGIQQLVLTANGAQGGIYTGAPATPGYGGSATGTLSVTSGTVYYYCVGQTGGNNGSNTNAFCGGGAALPGTYGGGGGMTWFGASSTFSTSSVIIVGAGGGGAAYSSPYTGGNGGGLTGTAGVDVGYSGGQGGSQTAGGAAGYNSGCDGGSNPTAGSAGQGGNSGSARGGGGGGGYYGGGGGGDDCSYGGGGGGGSSYLSNLLTSTSTASGMNASTGTLAITEVTITTSTTDFVLAVPHVTFTLPTQGTTTSYFSNWQLKADTVTSTDSYSLTVNWDNTAGGPAQTSTINASGTALLSGVNVPHPTSSLDYTYDGTPVTMDATATLYDTSTLTATSSVVFTELTALEPLNCGTTTIQCISYQYDNDGNVTQMVDNASTSDAITVNYTYDHLNRLVAASSSNAVNGQNYNQTFTYDPVGNLLSGPDGTYTYGGTGYPDPDAVKKIVSGSSTTSFSYDNDGNLTNASSGPSYTWDYHNWLLSVTSSSASSSYGYDYTGERVSVVSGSSTTYYPETTYNVSGGSITKNIFADGILVGTIQTVSGSGGGSSTSTISVHATSTVTSLTAAATSATTTLSVATGTLILVACEHGTTFVPPNNVTDTVGNAFTLLTNASDTTTGNLATYWATSTKASASDVISCNFASSVHYRNVAAIGYDGVNQSSPLDASSFRGTASTATATSSQPITTSNANDVLVSFAYAGVADLSSVNSPFTDRTPTSSALGIADDIVSSTQTNVSSTWHATASTDWMFNTGAFKAASGTTSSATSTAVFYVNPDDLGGANVVTNASGTVTETLSYYPYGAIRLDKTTSSFSGEQRKYIGQQYDAATQLSYLNARYYNGAQGQFISQDPLFLGIPNQQTLADPQSLSAYSYAEDNPVIRADTTGKYVEEISRPVFLEGVDTGYNHTFLYVVPEPGENLSAIYDSADNMTVNTSQPFTLSGEPSTPVGGMLVSVANNSYDSGIASTPVCVPGVARVRVSPPNGMTSSMFDESVVSSFNNLSQGQEGEFVYNYIGARQVTGGGNSNNVNTTLLENAGVSSRQMNSIQTQLTSQGANNAPGLGTSLSSPSPLQATLSALSSALSALSSLLSKL